MQLDGQPEPSVLSGTEAREVCRGLGPLGRQWWLGQHMWCVICVCSCMGWCSGDHMVREVFEGPGFQEFKKLD